MRWYTHAVRAPALAAAAAVLSQSAAADPVPDATLTVALSGFVGSEGRAGCTLYRSSKGFPTEPALAAGEVWCPIHDGAAACVFPGVPPGEAAVACFHDVDGDGTLDRDWIGLPTEPFVVSNHARPFFGPPRWSDARFLVTGSATLNLRLGG